MSFYETCFINLFFKVKNAAFGEFIKQLNLIMDKLKDKGSDKVTVKDLRKILQSKNKFLKIKNLLNFISKQ